MHLSRLVPKSILSFMIRCLRIHDALLSSLLSRLVALLDVGFGPSGPDNGGVQVSACLKLSVVEVL